MGVETLALVALLITATAAEAVVNRLLEPVVSKEMWEGTEGKRGLERASPIEKWKSLAKRLGVDLREERARRLLDDFAAVITARNDLVHYKHGKNLLVQRREVPASWARGVATVEVGGATADSETIAAPKVDLQEALSPARVVAHYVTVRPASPCSGDAACASSRANPSGGCIVWHSTEAEKSGRVSLMSSRAAA